MTEQLAPHLTGTPTRMVTIALRDDGLPLADRLTRLYASFRRLRHRAFWRSNVTAGIAFLEITRGRDLDHWHVHMHILCKGNYIAQDQLSAEWLTCTADSSVVDVRLVRDDKKALDYVTKYATKSIDSSVYEADDWLQEAIVALCGVRTIVTFGAWNKLRLTDVPIDTGWVVVASLQCIRRRAADGDADALDILERLKKQWEPTNETDPRPT